MARQLQNGLLKIVVQPVHRVLLGGGGGAEKAPLADQLPQGLADVGVVGQHFGDDVRSARQGLLRGLHTLLRVHVGRRHLRRVAVFLGENGLRQPFQPLFPGYGGPCAPLLLVGPVQIFHLREGGGAVDGGGQGLRQLALALDGGLHLGPPLVQVPQIGEPVGQGAQGGVVHGAVELLAVPGDKGHRGPLVQQGDDVFHVPGLLLQLPGQNLGNGFHSMILSDNDIAL